MGFVFLPADEGLLSLVFWLVALPLLRLSAFPLDDDWAYGEPVRRWLAGGGLHLSNWGAPTLLGHLAWGALFCLPGGFSYLALRVSTLVLSWLGMLALHRILLRQGAGRTAALAGALALLFNPIYFVLSYSFMTDVPALAWMLIACYALMIGFSEDKPEALWVGSVAAAAAYLVRQTGACAAAGAALWAWMDGRRDWRLHARLLLPTLAAVLFRAAWTAARGAPMGMSLCSPTVLVANVSHLGRFLVDLGDAASGAVLFLAVSLMPFVLARKTSWPPSRLALLGLAVAALPLLTGHLPVGLSLIGTLGLGMCSLSAGWLKPSGFFRLHAFWQALAVAAAAGIVVLTPSAKEVKRALKKPSLLAWVFGSAFALSLLIRPFLDRYLLVLLPPALAWAAARRKARPGAVSWLAVGFLAAWSVLGTWDYAAWTAAKWTGAERLGSMGVPAGAVNAGFEWNGVHVYEPSNGRARAPKPWAYVSFASGSRNPDFTRAGDVPYFSPLTMRTERLYLWRVQKRINPGSP